MERPVSRRWAAALCALLLLLVAAILVHPGALHRPTYTAEDFGIETWYSGVDHNENGLDDAQDLLLGARQDAQNHPRYDSSYWDGGYPPENVGVCTDVIWRAFRQAGYSLREMVDADIQAAPQAYPHIQSRDKNIDFRRVNTLMVFFRRHALHLTTDVSDITQWQRGDIVVFDEGTHIGMVSDLRNPQGVPYIIHQAGQPRREEDILQRSDITAHYRFDAALLPPELMISWQAG